MPEEVYSPEENIKRTLFELESFRASLDLGDGDNRFPQVGGIYGKMKTLKGFSRHHIPSNAVQNADKNSLPAILITNEDHKKTDSFAGKQHSKHVSFLPDKSDSLTYKEKVGKEIAKGNYIDVVKAEIYNIIDKCGHRYDGAIKSCLEALENYIRKNGIPNSTFGGKK